MIPIARNKNIVVQETGDELLVYDTEANRAVCLNPTSAMVWKHCDGSQSPWEIGKALRKELGKPVSEDIVWLALKQLDDENLLDEVEDLESRLKDISRTEAIEQIGLSSAITLPLGE